MGADGGGSPSERGDGQADERAVDLVRRRLLAAGGRYVAPAIVASLLMESRAAAQTASCGPTQCQPAQIPCGPVARCRPGR